MSVYTPVIEWITITRGPLSYTIATEINNDVAGADPNIFLLSWPGLLKMGEARMEKRPRVWASGSVHNRYVHVKNGKEFKLVFFIRDQSQPDVEIMAGTKASFADFQYILSDAFEQDHGRHSIYVDTSWGPYGPYTCRVVGDDMVTDQGAFIYEVNLSAEESR